MTRQTAPLRLIVDRPSQTQETLECGHTIARPCGLGEDLTKPSTAKRRRCFECVRTDTGPVTTCIEHAYGSAQRLSFQIKVF